MSRVLDMMKALDLLQSSIMASSPFIGRVPPELLLKIFEYAVLDAHASTKFRSGDLSSSRSPWIQHPTPHRPPYTLGQVCRRWRVMVAASADLWNTVYLIVCASDAGALSRNCTALDNVLRASGSYPLRIRLAVAIDPVASHALQVASRLLFTQYARIQHLEVSLDFATPLPPLAALPNLTSLSLRWRNFSEHLPSAVPPSVPARAWFAIVDMPKLSYISYHCSAWADDLPRLPWNITRAMELDVGGAPWQDVFKIISAATSATDLRVRSVRGLSRYVLEHPATPVALPTLKRAKFLMHTHDLLNVVASFQWLQLETLHVQAADAMPLAFCSTATIQRAAVQLANANASLVSLHLLDVDLPDDILLAIMSNIVQLKEFTLRCQASGPGTGRAPHPGAKTLLRRWAHTQLSPHLRVLVLLGSSCAYALDEDLFGALQSRCTERCAKALGVSVLSRAVLTRRYCHRHDRLNRPVEGLVASLALPPGMVTWQPQFVDKGVPYASSGISCCIACTM